MSRTGKEVIMIFITRKGLELQYFIIKILIYILVYHFHDKNIFSYRTLKQKNSRMKWTFISVSLSVRIPPVR